MLCDYDKSDFFDLSMCSHSRGQMDFSIGSGMCDVRDVIILMTYYVESLDAQ